MQTAESLFFPRSVAVVGASKNPTSLGTAVIRNLMSGEFQGPILPVNRKYESVLGILCYKDVPSLPIIPELAVICTPADVIPDILDQLGQKGCKAAIILSVDQTEEYPAQHTGLKEEIRQAAKRNNIRFLGPNSTGIQVPRVGLNASWITTCAKEGKVALVSQSGAFAAGVVEWANQKDIGFSHIICAGDPVDVDLSEILDFLAIDPKTRAVLLFIRDIQDARLFMSAASALSRIKPVIAIKAYQSDGSGRIDHFMDAVYDEAFRRAGMLRVHNTDELFDAAETLTYTKSIIGERLAIICNGGGPGMMAADTIAYYGDAMAQITDKTVEALGDIVNTNYTIQNPIDLGRSATPEQYQKAIEFLLKDKGSDALLVMHSPTALASAEDVARAVTLAKGNTQRPVLACWLGDSDNNTVKSIFKQAATPVYPTPDRAIRAFHHLVEYHRNQKSLLQTPKMSMHIGEDTYHNISGFLDIMKYGGRTLMQEEETFGILNAYGFPTIRTEMARDIDEVIAAAENIGFPVSLRLSSPTVVRQQAVGNIAWDLMSVETVKSAALSLEKHFKARFKDQDLPLFVVQEMVRRPNSKVLKIGIETDPTFGPVVKLSRGGTAHTNDDKMAVALPPLNMALAETLIENAGFTSMLRNGSSQTSLTEWRLCGLLVQLSQMIVDFPALVKLEIDPLLVDDEGVIVLDARVEADFDNGDLKHMAIKPYPHELEEYHKLPNGSEVHVRPIRPEDEPLYKDMLRKLSPEDLYTRFCGETSSMQSNQLAKLIHIDYDREMTFVATALDYNGETEILGVVDALSTQKKGEAEFSIVVRSDLKGQKLGKFLLDKMINYCQGQKLDVLSGLVLKENEGMLGLSKRLGFVVDESFLDDDMVKIDYPLQNGQDH